ncbi:hypothetical protein PIROE2DRAFT_12924 [Piromyces sp. E2]|nr:hypothetical protein PIROE2DRAFT_12924 [Piromyces sp. E2]|eukprot:OUM61129.1 hypothetical protein PIROE2DRAFT_12924 [Piromyces sp. E2]
MKFKAIFKKLSPKKHDKKPTINNRLSPVSPSPLSSPNTASPLKSKPVDFPQRKPSSIIHINQTNVCKRRYSGSSTSSNSLPTSFPPNSYFSQPIKQNEVIEEGNQESVDYSQVTTIPSPSRRTSFLKANYPQKFINQDNFDKLEIQKNSVGKMGGSNDMFFQENGYNTAPTINSNEGANSSSPSKYSCSPNENENLNTPNSSTLYNNGTNEVEGKRNNEINHNNNSIINDYHPGNNDGMINNYHPGIETINKRPGTVKSMVIATPPRSPLSPTLSISSPRKKNHNIFGYLKKKGKKDKELKTVFKNFSVMDTQSIEHEGIIMVENQNNALHSLWEQRNYDLMKRNSKVASPISSSKITNTEATPHNSPLNNERKSVSSVNSLLDNERKSMSSVKSPLDNERKSISSVNTTLDNERRSMSSLNTPLDNERKSMSSLNSPLYNERKNMRPFSTPINIERKNVTPVNAPLILKRSSSKNSPVSSPRTPHSLLNSERMSSPIHSTVNLERISTSLLFKTDSLERITSPKNHERISPRNSLTKPERISSLKSPKIHHEKISPMNSPKNSERINLLRSPINRERVSPTSYSTSETIEKISSAHNIPGNSDTVSPNQYNIPGNLERISSSPLNSPNLLNTLTHNINTQRNSYCNGAVNHSPSLPKHQENPYATSPRYKIYMIDNATKSNTDLSIDTIKIVSNISSISKPKVSSPAEKPFIPGRNDSLFNKMSTSPQSRPSSYQSSSPSRIVMELGKPNIVKKNNGRINLHINTGIPVRNIYSPRSNPSHISPNGHSLKLTSPLPPPRTRKSPVMGYAKLSSPISPNTKVSSEDILGESVNKENNHTTENKSISKETLSLFNSIIEKEKQRDTNSTNESDIPKEKQKNSISVDKIETEKEKQKNSISIDKIETNKESVLPPKLDTEKEKQKNIYTNVIETDAEKESVLANYLAERTENESDIISVTEKITEQENENTEKGEITEDSKEKITSDSSINEVDKNQNESNVSDMSNVYNDAPINTSNNTSKSSSSTPSYTESVKSKTSTLSKISNSIKTSIKSFAKSLGGTEEINENDEVSRISRSSSISSFSSSSTSDSSDADDANLSALSNPKNPVIEITESNSPMNQDEAIKYNIENMKPIKIIHETKNIDNLGKRTSGILKNRSSNSILKNKSSFSILKNNRNSGGNYGNDIASFPIKLDVMPQKLNNKISMESKKSRVSFCESKNVYRNIDVDRKNSAKLKRISNGSSIIPYIVEKSLNQTTILNESSIKFDNYSTTESFSILKGSFINDNESINANIDFSDNEIGVGSPVESAFDRHINNMPSLSSINFSYDSDIAEVTEEKIKIFDQHLNNNETNSSATIYHNGRYSSLDEPLNKRQNSNTFHDDDEEEISNIFESQSDNRTSFIVIGKDSTILKDDSLFEKEAQDNTASTSSKISPSKLKNDIVSSNNKPLDSPASVNAVRHFPQNGNVFDYTPSYPSSTVSSATNASNNNNINSNYSIYFNNFYI